MPHFKEEKVAQPVAQESKKSRLKNLDQDSIVIMKPVEEVFSFWRNFHNIPLFMKDIGYVVVLSSKSSHWVANEAKAEWDAQIVHEIPYQLISWSSFGDSEVTTSGTVWFEPEMEGEATRVQLSMDSSIQNGRKLIPSSLKKLKNILEAKN